jgi:hypothetical protein
MKPYCTLKACGLSRMSRGGSLPPNFDVVAAAFKALATTLGKAPPKSVPTRFVKKLDICTQRFVFRTGEPRLKALSLAERGLIGSSQASGPPHIRLRTGCKEAGNPTSKARLNHFFLGKDFFAFLFQFKEE